MVAPPTTGRARHRLDDLVEHEAVAESPRSPRWLEPGSLATLLIVAGTTAFVLAQLHLNLVFGPNMDVGGDTAAHVVAVNYFVHHLITNGRLAGWDPEWFGGFPLYVFYFPFPAVVASALTLVMSYAVAFKVTTILGVTFLPLAAYAFGRLSGFRRPVPALMSAATIPYLFLFAPSYPHSSVYYSWNIDGGTLASMLAGEFSFSLAVTFALLFLGVFTYAQRTGRLRWLAAILFAVTLLCHVVPGLFAAVAALVIAISKPSRRALFDLFVVGAVGAFLAAFWLLPFASYLHYSSSMNYNRVGAVYDQLFPRNAEQIVQWLAVAGLLFAIHRRHRRAIVIGVLAAASVAAFVWLPDGLVYNGRWLPFWFLTTALLAAYAVAELGRVAFRLIGVASANEFVTPILGSATVICLIAAWLGVLPFVDFTGKTNPVDGWAIWNYSGYQAKPGWPQFQRVVAMLESAASIHGCGNLDYEYSPNTQNVFGSTLVPLSFPMWTHGCIGSAEGLYYESSTTNHFHFLDQSELSLQASNPVVGLPYQSLDVADGIRHLQLTGVKYFLASSPTVEAAAAKDPALQEIASTPESANVVDDASKAATYAYTGDRWALYEIRNSTLVEPLRYLPVVENLSYHEWQWTTAIDWYQLESDWPVEIVSSGPKAWQRVVAGALVEPTAARSIVPTAISHVHYGNSTFSFDVSSLDKPVLVKVPYFPNWVADGASGPYEATPNLMVVVPHRHHVVLDYQSTTIDWLGVSASGLGIAGAVALVRSGNPPSPDPEPAPESESDTLVPFDRDGPDDGDGPAADGGEEPPQSPLFGPRGVRSQSLDPDEPWRKWFGTHEGE
ncbi:MAG: hypothetical protein WCF24_04680 [Acidimicrobiales bacterium]